ncbi:MAG TPA: peptidyl-prolyl cis-trans isomerase [Nitrospirales bacterium]|nr:peptidyl-prolyl cis-trans isomerase [Nitrospirales bacterium]
MTVRAGHVTSLASAALAVSLAVHAAPVTDRIIAVVNKELITLSELQNELEPFQKRLKQKYHGAELERLQRQMQYTLLTRMIERKLQIQIAKTKGVDVTEDDILRAIQEMRRQGEKIDEANPEDKKAIREQLLLLRLVDREVRSGVMVSEPDMKRYYETHQTRFSLPEEYRLSQILLAPKSSESRGAAMERAKLLVAMLRKGSDFAELALKHSDGAEATRGGNLGFVRQGELVAPIERVIATLQPGQVSDPIETPEGIHILRVEEKKPSQFRPFAEVKNEIQGLVYQQKTEDVYQLWIADIKNKAFIEVKF